MLLVENKAIIQRMFERYNAHDLDGVAAALSADFVYHNPLLPGKLGGKEDIVQRTAQAFSAFPDIRWTVEELIAEGDRVVARLTFGGTNTGSLMGLPPTLKKGEVTGILAYRLAEGISMELWEECDYLGFLQQLGLSGLPQ